MRRRPDRKGSGSFVETFIALMVVTGAFLILTASLALIAAHPSPANQGKESEEVMGRLLSDRSIVLSDRMISGPSLVHHDFGSDLSHSFEGIRIMLVGPDGKVAVLYENGTMAGERRSSCSEPVNVYYGQADVRPALLMVWVWP